MRIYEKNIHEITIGDIDELIENEFVENNYLEYKSNMVGKKESDNILRTVCAFANNDGGLLIYGLNEEDGIPKYVGGVELEKSWDNKKLDLYHLIENKIEPKLNVEIEKLDIPNLENIVILFKVPKCFNIPYRVNNNNFKDFFKRLDGESISVPYSELKNIFISRTDILREIDNFLGDSLEKILSVYSEDNFKVIFHSFPLYYQGLDLDIASVEKYCYYSRNGRYFYNSDGLKMATDDSYLQIYRNGICENTYFELSDSEITSFATFENVFKNFILECIELYKHEKIFQPIVFYVSYVNISQFKKLKQNKFVDQLNNDKNIISSKIEVYDYDEDIDVKKAFAVIFNHFGFDSQF